MHSIARTNTNFQRETQTHRYTYRQNKCRLFKDKCSKMQMTFKQCEISNVVWKQIYQSSALFLDRVSFICKANPLQEGTKKPVCTHTCILKNEDFRRSVHEALEMISSTPRRCYTISVLQDSYIQGPENSLNPQ